MNGLTSLLAMPQWVPSLIGCWGYGPGSGWDNMMYYGYGGMFMWIIFAAIFGLLIYFVVKSLKRGQVLAPIESPLDILKKRYAKGEINKDDFDRMKKDL